MTIFLHPSLRLSLIGALGVIASGHVQAHVTNWNLLDTATTVVGSGVNSDPCAGLTLCQSSANFTRYSWYDGTQAQLSDSHTVTTNAEAFTFHLTSDAYVTITDAAYGTNANRLNPAFSVYRGLLPALSHDGASPDESNPVDFNSPLFASKMSSTDHAPGDPNIAHYIDDGSGTGLIENPAWTQPFAGSGGLTAEQWYAANYIAHNGYRDTLNGTTTGGIDTDPSSGNFAGLLHPYLGQFDAFGNWSMNNANGEWGQIDYISSVSSTACNGQNCGETTTGGFTNPGHFEGNNGAIESLILHLAAGDYTIWAGGESGDSLDGIGGGCIGVNGGINLGCSAGAGNYRAAISLQINEVSSVPLPASIWLFGSALLGLLGFHRRDDHLERD
ncbi:VPLPA-CTERM sorting domain-containing protein [Methylomonas sp. UP202]|uniref:VPLPA-CTERM sorting domain-containing protein n=1 Tax=Methylomonas sp. UP202 TaxID=3040943 RepID=UPI00247A1C2F|nr:VPLPA-CTERM sorting domain-containing protein [Methylomonas sp. UP202]WGS85765.1 VPLPA-CTERM sorting domain-containing protein [Methylomonas sp. UP202]